MKTPILGIACAGLLVACTPAELERAGGYQAQFAAVCQIAMASTWANPWVVTVCGTEALVAHFALDPRVWAWVNEIADQVQKHG